MGVVSEGDFLKGDLRGICNSLKKSMKQVRFILAGPRGLLDAWSIPHFLFGTVMALVAVVFQLPLLKTFFVLIFIAIFWEFFEMHMKLRENIWNVISDVILPLLAYPITVWLVQRTGIQSEEQVAFLLVAALIYLYSNMMAWQARFQNDPEYMS